MTVLVRGIANLSNKLNETPHPELNSISREFVYCKLELAHIFELRHVAIDVFLSYCLAGGRPVFKANHINSNSRELGT